VSTYPNIGDVVESVLHGYVGLVFFVHPTLYDVQWSTDANLDEWFKKQNPPLHPVLKGRHWIEMILLNRSGSVLLPASTVKVHVPFSRIKNLLLEFAENAKKTK
jgi:hypothetical protein